MAHNFSTKPQIAVFARRPKAGRVKTRLGAALGEEAAAALYTAFLADTLELCVRAAPGGVRLWLTPEPDTNAAETIAGTVAALAALGVTAPPATLQQGADLGARMAHALGSMLGEGPALVVGSDAPDLPGEFITAAFGALAESDLALGPTEDGGYYLVASRTDVGDLFEGIAWSAKTTFDETLARARARGLRVATLGRWRDVDDAADHAALLERLARARSEGRAVPRHTMRSLG